MAVLEFVSEGHTFHIRVEAAAGSIDHLVETVLDIDQQTFSESTFSHYTAAAFLLEGRMYLLYADDVVIGTCVLVRCWSRPSEVMVLSLAIRPGWRGRGLGQHFLFGVITRLRTLDVQALLVMVSRENRRALSVYEDVGFVPEAEVAHDPRSGEPLVMMRYALGNTSE